MSWTHYAVGTLDIRRLVYVIMMVEYDLATYRHQAIRQQSDSNATMVSNGNIHMSVQPLTHHPEQNGRRFADDIFRCISVKEKFCTLVKISYTCTVHMHCLFLSYSIHWLMFLVTKTTINKVYLILGHNEFNTLCYWQVFFLTTIPPHVSQATPVSPRQGGLTTPWPCRNGPAGPPSTGVTSTLAQWPLHWGEDTPFSPSHP